MDRNFLGVIAFAGLVMTACAEGQQPSAPASGETQVRAREIGIAPGVLEPGPHNAITDVDGVLVGQITVIEAPSIRTGVTAILPHGGNLYSDKVPSGVVVGNGYGKLMGSTQIMELGEIETPILLTNTMSVTRAGDGILDWTLRQAGNENVRSVNMVVGETNDARLNDIRARIITAHHAVEAIETATSGPVEEGGVGAGAGTVAFGWKGGIGTSSRQLPEALGGYTIGVLIQSNYGGILQMDGLPVGESLNQFYLDDHVADDRADGSIMIIVATDAPLSDRNLTRLARRTFAGLARTGASLTNGSGDYAIAFSTHPGVRRTEDRRRGETSVDELANSGMSPLFQATIEATEEAIYNSLLMATSASYEDSDGQMHHYNALPVDQIRSMVDARDLAGGD